MNLAMAPDDDFGPQYGSSFDFTLKFDHTILQILPNAIIIVLAPWQIWHFKRQRQVILSDALLWSKMAASVLLFFTQVASLILCALSPQFHTSDSITAASLSCVAVSLVVLLLNLGHRYSIHSSGLLSLWLTSTCITDGTTARSYLLREHFAILGSLKIAGAVLKLSLVILEEWPKTKYEQDSNSPVSGDTVTGFWNRVLLVWLNKTMLFGYHNVLRIDNLLALDEAFDATALALRFHRFWTISNPKSKYRLAKASIRASIVPCLSIIFPRLSFTFFMFIQPFYIEAVVSIIQEPGSLTVKAALVGAASLIYFGVTISRSAYEQKNNQLSTIMRGMLVSAINVKTMDLPQSQRELSSAVTLMSTDVESVVVGIPLIFEFVFNLLEIGLGIYFLVTMVNQAAFLVAFPVFTGAFISWLLGKSLPPARVLWNEKVEDRVAKTSRMLSQLKAIKMIGLEQVATKHIHNLRAIEIKYSVKARVLTIVVNMTAGICNTLTPTLVFAGAIFWTTFKEKLTPIEVFKTVAFIALVTGPLEGSVRAYAETFSTLACIQRIQKYLLLPSVEDPRQLKQDFLSEQPQSPDDHINTVVGFHQAFLAPYAQPEKVILHDLSFALQKKNILIVTGPTGCGKSTLLQSFLGEVEKTSGVMFIEKGLAGYCDQSVWLRNVTVKENIVGYGVFHAGWYGRVLDTCLLREDLELWANGDQYLAGNNGSNLSGGQRQRVALARCLYSRAPFMVLDDVFSAVDNTTKFQIVGRLFGDHGLLRELETTVILATHSVDLFHVADKILFIRADGTSSIESDTDSSSFQKEISNILKYNDSISRRLENIESFDEQGGPFQEEAPLPQDTSAEQDEDNDELALRQRGDLDLHLFFLKTIGIVKTIVWLLITVGTLIIERFPDVFLRIWIDNAPENKTYFIGYALISLSSNFTGCGQLLFWYASAVPASLETLHQMLLDTVMKAKLSFLTRIDNGVLLNRFSQDMTGVSQTLPLIFMRTVAGFFYMFIGMVIILSATKYTGTAIPVVLGILYLVQRYYLRTSRQLRYLDLESKSPIYTDLTEMTAGLMHIRGFGWETQTIDRSLKLLNVSQKPFYYMFAVQRWLGVGMDFTVFLLALVTLTTALSLPQNSQLSGIALSLVTLLMFSNDMTRVIRDWTTLETSLGSIARIRSFVDSTPAEKDIGGAVSSEWPDGGNVVMTNVTASYGSEADVASVLQDISIDIPSGSRYGIIGRTGSGKSSLLLTLLNFLEYNGTIKIDGVDISTVSQQVLRSRITTISQDMVEFDESVRHNLCPWMVDMSEEEKDAQEHRVAELLARLGLWPLIRQHGGIDAMVSDLGLSQGQKQLMAIARGLLHRRRTGGKLVLMDEVTSNLDWQTDALVHRLIKVDLADCTVITIGHRAIATHDSDKIVRISGGAIEAVEDGHPGEEVDVEDFPVPTDLKEQVEAIQQKRREAKSEGSRRISVQRLRAIFKRS